MTALFNSNNFKFQICDQVTEEVLFPDELVIGVAWPYENRSHQVTVRAHEAENLFARNFALKYAGTDSSFLLKMSYLDSEGREIAEGRRSYMYLIAAEQSEFTRDGSLAKFGITAQGDHEVTFVFSKYTL